MIEPGIKLNQREQRGGDHFKIDEVEISKLGLFPWDKQPLPTVS